MNKLTGERVARRSAVVRWFENTLFVKIGFWGRPSQDLWYLFSRFSPAGMLVLPVWLGVWGVSLRGQFLASVEITETSCDGLTLGIKRRSHQTCLSRLVLFLDSLHVINLTAQLPPRLAAHRHFLGISA